MKNALDGINSILDTAEIKISELEDKAIETIQNEAQTGKRNFWKYLQFKMRACQVCKKQIG